MTCPTFQGKNQALCNLTSKATLTRTLLNTPQKLERILRSLDQADNNLVSHQTTEECPILRYWVSQPHQLSTPIKVPSSLQNIPDSLMRVHPLVIGLFHLQGLCSEIQPPWTDNIWEEKLHKAPNNDPVTLPPLVQSTRMTCGHNLFTSPRSLSSFHCPPSLVWHVTLAWIGRFYQIFAWTGLLYAIYRWSEKHGRVCRHTQQHSTRGTWAWVNFGVGGGYCVSCA